MQRDTMFRIASMSKPVTVAAAMTLLDEGRFALTDPVAKWLPELSEMRVLTDLRGSLDDTVPAERPITFDDLMTHRSGLAYVFSVPGPLARAYGRAVASSGPGQVAGRTGRTSAGASARRAADLQRRHRRARHRIVADRGQAAGRRAVRAHLRTAWHARHRLQRRPERTPARGNDVPTRRRRHVAPRLDGPGAHHGSRTLQWRRGPVVDGRRLSAVRADAARGRNARRGAGAVRGVRTSDAHRPAYRRAEARIPFWECRIGSAADSA